MKMTNGTHSFALFLCLLGLEAFCMQGANDQWARMTQSQDAMRQRQQQEMLSRAEAARYFNARQDIISDKRQQELKKEQEQRDQLSTKK